MKFNVNTAEWTIALCKTTTPTGNPEVEKHIHYLVVAKKVGSDRNNLTPHLRATVIDTSALSAPEGLAVGAAT